MSIFTAVRNRKQTVGALHGAMEWKGNRKMDKILKE